MTPRTLSEFRRRHLEVLSAWFAQIPQRCREAELVKLGHVAIDGTKVKATASRHEAMSYERMVAEEGRLSGQLLHPARISRAQASLDIEPVYPSMNQHNTL